MANGFVPKAAAAVRLAYTDILEVDSLPIAQLWAFGSNLFLKM